MLSLSPNSIAHSSLEEMLDSLRRRDSIERPKDMPPELPTRPKLTSRTRLPSAKRPLPPGIVELDTYCDSRNKEFKGFNKGNCFGMKRTNEMESRESPYVMEQSPRFMGDDSVSYFIQKKLRVWCQHNCQWQIGQIQSTSGEKASIMLSDGSVVTVPTQELLPANPDILEGVDDLTQLSYVNEPSVLHNLEYRFSQDVVYSMAGPVLIAVNPYKDAQIQGKDILTAYKQKLLDSPHVYAITDMAYSEMMTEGINQSIIISGESGSGKTQTAKTAMQYLAAIAGGSDGIESQFLQTSCILEAFGNAKTSRNDNSSRFGKIIEIHFTASGKICGAKIKKTLLLEKSRVVRLSQGERSYHIFYQLCAGAPSDLRGRLRLKSACDYKYLNQSNCLELHGVDDALQFHILLGGLDAVGISKDNQKLVFEMLAAVLWLGNISFSTIDDETRVEVVADEAVTNAAELMGCGCEDLMLNLSTCTIHVGNDKVSERLTLQQAADTRDALSKFIYESLFDWLVEKINLSLAVGKQITERSISILDIYGFESFKKNSLEQFCVNYANERLQQHFNRHLFNLEQEEYALDGIEFTKVDFEDNQKCLDLFEKKPIGIIALLDEESIFPESTGLSFATKLKQKLNANHCFKGEKDSSFTVCHCFREVLYDAREFIVKNRDPFHDKTIQLLSFCTSQLPQVFVSKLLNNTNQSTGSLIQSGISPCQNKTSVATKFKGQVFKLMQQLENTRPHFICCIKPNTKQIPNVFEKDLVMEQLRCCGVLEMVRISKSRYPTRMTHQEFKTRYGFLFPGKNACQDPLSTSVAILKEFDILPGMYQVGYTKLYFRSEQIRALEDVRNQVSHGTLKVRKCVCGGRARGYFHQLVERVVSLQSGVRGEIARKDYSAFLELRKQGTCIKEQLMAIVQIQSLIRGWLVRRDFRCLQNLKQSNGCSKQRQERGMSETKDLPPELLPSVVEELQKEVMMAEVTLEQKEKENETLREQMQQFEARWSEYEAKMKLVEETWQKQMASLQMSLAAAKKSLGADKHASRPDGTQPPLSYDSDKTSMGTHTPGGSTLNLLPNIGTDVTINGGSKVASPLAKEFEQKKQNFEDEALTIVEVKGGASSVQELRRLKHRFQAWKKDYKARLREAKAKAHRLGHLETEKHKRKWWGKKKNALLVPRKKD